MKALNPVKRRKIKDLESKFYVIDVETRGLSPKPENFIFGVIYGKDYMRVCRSPEEMRVFLDSKFFRGKKIFAHNAEFDLSAIYGNIYKDLDDTAVFNGKFIFANSKNTTFCCSTNLFPTSVKKIGEIIGLPKLDIDDEYTKAGTTHYIKITDKMIKYCIRDCEIVYKALLNLFEFIGGLKITIASSAMHLFRSQFLDEPIYYNPELQHHFFESYFGGRTEVFRMGECKAKVYDINSLYPDTMKKEIFPNPANLIYKENISLELFDSLLLKYEGCAKVLIDHKDTYLGFIPIKKDNKLIFPTGIFWATINFPELRFALETETINILSVSWACYSVGEKSIFEKYVDVLYNLKNTAINEIMIVIYKLLLNSLYGKFGMKKKYKTKYYEYIPYDLLEKYDNEHKIYIIKLFNTERTDCYIQVEDEKLENSYNSIPSYASYVTSYSRIKLLKGLISTQFNNLVYCDTDSLFIEDDSNIKELITVGNEIGEYKLEKKFIHEIRGLKNYVYEKDGKIIEGIKGVPSKAVKIEEGVEDGVKFARYEIEKYVKTKQAIRNELVTGDNYMMNKKIFFKSDKRTVLPDGNTKTLKLKENDIKQ
jgi:hypothetical protein